MNVLIYIVAVFLIIPAMGLLAVAYEFLWPVIKNHL